MSEEAAVQWMRIDADEATRLLPDLIALLRDVVDSGASIGFLKPISEPVAAAFWIDVIQALRGPNRILLIARHAGAVAGSVQLDLANRPNSRHRAEVQKLIVHSAHRRAGIGRALMQAIEEQAVLAGRSTLVLDTRLGDPAELLYLGLGYNRAGIIPNYVCNEKGVLESTVVMYKLLA